MTLRAIDLQFALHKNDEVGLKQNQLNQKPVVDQAALSEAAQKETLAQRGRSMKMEETNGASIRDEGKQGGGNAGDGNKSRKSSKQAQSGGSASSKPSKDHPFKGHHIDLSL
ncbi:hypothetical protein [Paenibacillus sp. YYML68]|uniref:hypothetical protein n=1 Tax=Paenibacillus sp. YYML68 TaxID=2909250 RepID=UPI002490E8ED|nr:hypothetical protein [Paenibacillus sp. YYML68]